MSGGLLRKTRYQAFKELVWTERDHQCAAQAAAGPANDEPLVVADLDLWRDPQVVRDQLVAAAAAQRWAAEPDLSFSPTVVAVPRGTKVAESATLADFLWLDGVHRPWACGLPAYTLKRNVAGVFDLD